jgi:hypothetical protein
VKLIAEVLLDTFLVEVVVEYIQIPIVQDPVELVEEDLLEQVAQAERLILAVEVVEDSQIMLEEMVDQVY